MDERVDLRALAEDVAKELGPEWRLAAHDSEGGDRWAHVGREDDAAISLHIVTWPKPPRLSISGNFPRPVSGGDYGPSGYGEDRRVTIHVGLGRPAKAVAAEIRRRLLPTYVVQYAKSIERKAQDEDGRAKADALAAKLAAILGEKVSEPWRGGDRCVRLYRGDWYGDVTVSQGGSVTIDLRSLPAAIAEAVCRALPRVKAA